MCGHVCEFIISFGLSFAPSLSLSCTETLPYLFQFLFVLDFGLAPLVLQLIHAALSGIPPKKGEESSLELDGRSNLSSRSSRKKELEEMRKAKGKSKDKESKVSIVGMFILQYSISNGLMEKKLMW